MCTAVLSDKGSTTVMVQATQELADHSRMGSTQKAVQDLDVVRAVAADTVVVVVVVVVGTAVEAHGTGQK